MRKILHWSKLKAFADNKIKVNEKLKCGFGRVENIVEKGENAFFPFPTMFSKAVCLRVVKSMCRKLLECDKNASICFLIQYNLYSETTRGK